MPTYTFRHKKNGKTQSDFMSISEMEEWIKANPQWEAACGAPVIGYNTYSVRTKQPSWLKEKLTEIKKANPGSSIDV